MPALLQKGSLQKKRVVPLKNRGGLHLPIEFLPGFSNAEKPETRFDIANISWVKQLIKPTAARSKDVCSEIFFGDLK